MDRETLDWILGRKPSFFCPRCGRKCVPNYDQFWCIAHGTVYEPAGPALVWR